MRNRRNGRTLVEMIAIIGVLGLVLTLAGQTFVLLLRADSRGRDALVARVALGRLAAQFRSDVRAATDATLAPADGDRAAFLTLQLGSETTVEYAAIGRGVQRELTAQGEVVRREQFPLPDSAAGFELESDGLDVVSVVITGDDAAEAGLRFVRIDAVRGRDRIDERGSAP